MAGSNGAEERRALLAFVDRYWPELTLRDASVLCPESLELFLRPLPQLSPP